MNQTDNQQSFVTNTNLISILSISYLHQKESFLKTTAEYYKPSKNAKKKDKYFQALMKCRCSRLYRNVTVTAFGDCNRLLLYSLFGKHFEKERKRKWCIKRSKKEQYMKSMTAM